MGKNPGDFPLDLQWNKRDLPQHVPRAPVLEQYLKPYQTPPLRGGSRKWSRSGREPPRLY